MGGSLAGAGEPEITAPRGRATYAFGRYDSEAGTGGELNPTCLMGCWPRAPRTPLVVLGCLKLGPKFFLSRLREIDTLRYFEIFHGLVQDGKVQEGCGMTAIMIYMVNPKL